MTDPSGGGADTPATTVRDIEAMGWTAGTFAHSGMFADLPGALLVLWLLAQVASRAAKIGLIADVWRRRRSLFRQGP